MYAQILQRCDAQRPCTTCISAGGESGCFYEKPRIPHRHHVIGPLPKTALSFPFSGEYAPGPSNVGSSLWSLGRTGEVTELSGNLGPQIDHSVRFDPDPVQQDRLFAASRVLSTPHAAQDCGPFVSWGAKHDVQPRPQRPQNLLLPSTGSKFSILPSLRLSIVPRPIHIPLSFFPPENFQVTGGTPGNREMSLYASLILLLRRLS